MARPYRMTPKRAAALKKAQIASAKKRKGTGKGRPVPKKRRAVAKAPVARRKVVRRAGKVAAPRSKAQINRRKVIRRAGAVAAVGLAVGGAAYTYKNRERLVVAKAAEHFAIKSAKAQAKANGKKLGKAEIRKVRMEERVNHANRSRYRVQEYKMARDLYKIANKKGMTMRPLQPKPLRSWQKAILIATGNKRSIRPISSGESIHKPLKSSEYMQNYMYNTYRKDVNARAVHRLNRIKGKKESFGYKSGKSKMVISGRVYRLPF